MQEDTELPRGIALAWGVAANPQRGPKREMSVERIVEAAVDLADAEGIGAVSMAAVAKKLGFTPMSLYRYVTAKDDLLLLMQEEATGVPSLAYRDAEGWRAKIGVLFREQVDIYLRHPWILSLPISGSPVTPNSSHWLEAGLEAVHDLPLDLEERLSVVLAVTGAARWQGMVYAGYDGAARESGRSHDEVARAEHDLYDRVIDADEYPRLRELIDSGAFVSDTDPLRFGLERTLDGIEAHLEGRTGAAHPPLPDDSDLDVADDKKYRAAVRATTAAEKDVRAAEKALRQARRAQAQALREARERRPG
ncbi:MAG: TetR/AcrR family transcriptional regulator [Candidatus Microbacterium stercoravium]|uniref:TetR/AcrR family transcriptional regulator n=1 Tax=Candidatus Microbacterium stercoravium TaxID=2838697 RepID=A0A9D2H5M2_9MICO|nr:TetR/AcrR family transcriptional regulator [Candidatus Microbacterium stercoravium]